MEKFTVRTTEREVIVDITSHVHEVLRISDITDGICIVYIPHTTAGVTINENADPAVRLDIATTLKKLVPAGANYRHLEGNSDSHIKASTMGSSVTVIVEDRRLQLGTWQGIQFCEFDGPRTRNVWVKVMGK